jgi:hypothetical protein
LLRSNVSATTNPGGREILWVSKMALKNGLNDTLTDAQRLERLTRLCEELQSAVDSAGQQRRILEELKQTAQELLTDVETSGRARRKKTQDR